MNKIYLKKKLSYIFFFKNVEEGKKKHFLGFGQRQKNETFKFNVRRSPDKNVEEFKRIEGLMSL